MVYLCGAGPGDVELLTIKAHKAILRADVIIYDRLANVEMLDLAKDGCEFIFVGKEDSKHTFKQEIINEIIYENSKKYKEVVRLKGGDPFVFGRGGEEAIYLKDRGVEFELIPGITSAISVPELSGIPVTHRGVATSFKVVTGHSSTKRATNVDFELLKDESTIIFLMGLHNIEHISSELIRVGKSPKLPIAIISKGSTPDQKVYVSDLGNVLSMVKKESIETPAMIIVGDVVSLREKII